MSPWPLSDREGVDEGGPLVSAAHQAGTCGAACADCASEDDAELICRCCGEAPCILDQQRGDGCRVCGATTNNADHYCFECLSAMAEDVADRLRDERNAR